MQEGEKQQEQKHHEETGVVSRYVAERGFGFIQRREKLGYAFFNCWNVQSDQLFADQPVTFKVRPQKHGKYPVAYDIRGIE